MNNFTPLDETQISNKCVILCDLSTYQDDRSACWRILKGTQEEIGREIASLLERSDIKRIDDFGGVSKSFLCDDEAYREEPPKTKPNAAIFSFTPKNRAKKEAHEMARAASKSGYRWMILTVQKHHKFGKVWVLDAILQQWNKEPLTYYEDTNTVIDEIKASHAGEKVFAVHVIAPGFEAYLSEKADRIISQKEYQEEVLRV